MDRLKDVIVAVICGLIVLHLPTVDADVGANTPAAVLDVENGHQTCNYDVAGNCVVNVTISESPGDSQVDASQNAEHITIATDFATVRDPLGENWLLPDDSITLHGDEIIIRHPVFRTTVVAWESSPTPTLLQNSPYRVVIRKENVTLHWLGPDHRNLSNTPNDPADHRSQNLTWNNDTMCYEECGPFVYPNHVESDVWYRTLETSCEWDFIPRGYCAQLPLREANETLRDTTPSVVYSASVYNVTVATDPDYAGGGSLSDRSSPDSPSIYHRDMPLEPLALPKKDPVAGRLETLPGPSGGSGGGPSSPKPPTETPVRVSAAKDPVPPGKPWWQKPATVAVATASVLFAVFAWLYTRFTSRRDLLSSPKRREIMAIVNADPGISQKEIGTRVGGLKKQAVAHHLRLMERAGLLVLRREGREICAYAEAAKAPESTLPAEHQVLEALKTRGPMLRASLHRFLAHVPRRTANDAIKRLITHGKVEEAHGPDGIWLRVVPI